MQGANILLESSLYTWLLLPIESHYVSFFTNGNEIFFRRTVYTIFLFKIRKKKIIMRIYLRVHNNNCLDVWPERFNKERSRESALFLCKLKHAESG